MNDTSEQRRSEDTAAEWIARLSAADASDGDRARFARWLAAKASHRLAYQTMFTLWDRAGAVAVANSVRVLPHPARRRMLVVPMALAATLIASIAIWLLTVQPTIIQTEIGEQRVVGLGDGSRIELNTATRIELAADAPQRNVTLRAGEAYFDVARDPARPFSVTTPHGTITVLGTRFNVRTSASASTVTVASGLVRVASDGAALELREGQAALIDGDAPPVAADRSAAAAGQWRGGRLVYDDVTLGELIADLNRYVPIRMALAKDTSPTLRISASLRLGDQRDMLKALTEILPLRYSQVSDELILLQSG